MRYACACILMLQSVPAYPMSTVLILLKFVYFCRRHGCRNRFVPPRRPTVGYFTDSTSMSGAGTDVSTNDASDEDSSEGMYFVYTSI